MAGEGEDEAAAIELQLEQHLQEQRSSLAAVDKALAADPSNADLLEVHEELLGAIKDTEEGLLHLKRSRLVKQIGEIFQIRNQHRKPQKLLLSHYNQMMLSQNHWSNRNFQLDLSVDSGTKMGASIMDAL